MTYAERAKNSILCKGCKWSDKPDSLKCKSCEAIPAYTQIAEEQKTIDIDKACDWLKARNVLTDASLEGFRKAMME